jgi:hypothetical protein
MASPPDTKQTVTLHGSTFTLPLTPPPSEIAKCLPDLSDFTDLSNILSQNETDQIATCG